MSEQNLLSTVANSLRPVCKLVSKGEDKLCLSTIYLYKLNKALDKNDPEGATSQSFHLSDAKATFQMDINFLSDLFKNTNHLKVTPDLEENEESTLVNLRRFINVKALEVHKVNVKNIVGIQKLRPHIKKLSCCYNLESVADILDKCGGDFSQKNIWSELKEVDFTHNRIRDIDNVFEATPWLHTLDLSHNEIGELDLIDHLPNLKRLNLSFNKLEKAPKFKGTICKRLQVLLLNNNFLEDISGLSTLSDLHQLNLSLNCLLDHNCLLSISQMSSLYSLDLRGNPIYYHPNHRTETCHYFNKNVSTLNVILNNVPLTITEKSFTGSLYPLKQSSLASNGSHSSQNSLDTSLVDRPRRVRVVDIQEGFDIPQIKKVSTSVTPSPRSTDKSHLDIKKKIENTRDELREKWLSSLLLDYPKPNIESECNGGAASDVLSVTDSGKQTDRVEVQTEAIIEQRPPSEQEEAIAEPGIESSFDNIVADSDLSSDEDIDDGKKFIAGLTEDSYDIYLVITHRRLAERDSLNFKANARWLLNNVKSVKYGDHPNEVHIQFDGNKNPMKYYVEKADEFMHTLRDAVLKTKVPDTMIQYKCWRCHGNFSKRQENRVLVNKGDEKVICPKCGGNVVTEDSK